MDVSTPTWVDPGFGGEKRGVEGEARVSESKVMLKVDWSYSYLVQPAGLTTG